MSVPLLTASEIRAALGSKADGMTEADLDQIAARVREFSVLLREVVLDGHAAPRRLKAAS